MDKKYTSARFEKTREKYRNEIPDIERKQMAEILTTPTLYALFKGVYYLYGYNDIGEIHREAKIYAAKDEADLEKLQEAIPFFRENGLIETDPEHSNPESFQISGYGKSVFYRIFDMGEFVIRPALSELLKGVSNTDEENTVRRNFNKTIEYILL